MFFHPADFQMFLIIYGIRAMAKKLANFWVSSAFEIHNVILCTKNEALFSLRLYCDSHFVWCNTCLLPSEPESSKIEAVRRAIYQVQFSGWK